METPLPLDVCLLVVDVQRQFVTPRTAGLLPRLAAALPGYRRIVFSRLVADAESPVARWKGFSPAPEDSAGAALAIEAPAGAEVWVTRKTGFTALTADARAWLAGRGVRAVHVCGMDTDLCVTRTLFDVAEAGFEPALRADLCASAAGEAMHAHGVVVAKRMIGSGRVRTGVGAEGLGVEPLMKRPKGRFFGR